MQKGESESAIMLWVPGICCAEILKLCLAARRKRLRRRDMMWGQWEVPDTKHCVMARLSRRVDHW